SGVRADGKPVSGDLGESLRAAVDRLRKHLPAEQAEHPAAVVLVAVGGKLSRAHEVVAALRAAGVRRVAIKREM
ncbi:MAG: hypothetical protein NTW87_25615, partial [Planctomycetota bacterium]|nr:hypothetical protein [Planctomycetota bacterium]